MIGNKTERGVALQSPADLKAIDFSAIMTSRRIRFRRNFTYDRERPLAIFSLHRFIALGAEARGKKAAIRFIIIYDQDSGGIMHFCSTSAPAGT